MMRQWEKTLSPRLKAALLFLCLYFSVLVVGFPVVVLALGFRLREGFGFVVANPTFGVVLAGLPFFCVLLAWAVEFKHWLHRRRLMQEQPQRRSDHGAS
jgi:hypothetical protein